MAGDTPSDKKSDPLAKTTISAETIDEIKRQILGIGYKKLPVHAQFKKGQRANPDGRPKQQMDAGLGNSRSATTLALKEAKRIIKVREGTETKQVPSIDAAMQAEYASAIRGNSYAQRHVIDRYDQSEREERLRRLINIEYWEGYIKEQRQAIAEAITNKTLPPDPLPHPDDIIIDFEKGVRITGPINEEEVAKLHETLAYRDALFMQSVLDQRFGEGMHRKEEGDSGGSALLFAMVLNDIVPRRFKLSDTAIERNLNKYLATSKRQLLKDMYRTWRAIGPRPRRSQTLPSLEVGKEILGFLSGEIKKITGAN